MSYNYTLKKLSNDLIEIIHDLPKPDTFEFKKIKSFFLGRVNDRWIAYDRKCNHNGGTLKLARQKNIAQCPIHDWRLDLSSGRYENGCTKLPLATEETINSVKVFEKIESFPEIATASLEDCEMYVDFNAHASVSVRVGGLSLITDPWLEGSCFATGWWHAFPPDVKAFERLRNANLIYISHNHPDHLHLPTLKKHVKPDTKFLVPNFESKSVETLLRREGFNNLLVVDFMEEITLSGSTPEKSAFVKLVLVKSGDSRDDSSLILFSKKNSVFFGVDTNAPNNWVLPPVTVAFSPFAGGASGYPSRIENFDITEKLRIIEANRASELYLHVDRLLRASLPKFVIPYAGYFTELGRDDDVRKINRKNSVHDFQKYVESHPCKSIVINPLVSPAFKLHGESLLCSHAEKQEAYQVDDAYVEKEIKSYTANIPTLTRALVEQIGASFLESSFYDDLLVLLLPGDSAFYPLLGGGVLINFSSGGDRGSHWFEINDAEFFNDREIVKSIRSSMQLEQVRIEILRVRGDALLGTLVRGLPLEDLSIGFQIKMFRDPNVYNFRFWDFFTNKKNIVL